MVEQWLEKLENEFLRIGSDKKKWEIFEKQKKAKLSAEEKKELEEMTRAMGI